MHRRSLNLSAAALIMLGAWVLSSPSALAQGGQSTCTAGNGATCSGTTCCADATACYTSEALCTAMFCDNHPNAPGCEEQPGG
jgi:hypothetical protein